MTDLLDLIADRLGLALVGEEFDDPEGGQMVPRIHQWTLPPKRSATADGEDFPFVLLRIVRGKEEDRGEITVRLIGGLYASDDEADGNADAVRLLEIMLGLAGQRSFTPYSMALPVRWWLGDEEQGVQPHPQYFATVELAFTRQATATKRR